MAGNLGVDLLLVDTGMRTFQCHFELLVNNVWAGDLHDGNGLSDAALPNGVLSNPIFDEIEYDVLTIGRGYFQNLGLSVLIVIQVTTSCILQI